MPNRRLLMFLLAVSALTVMAGAVLAPALPSLAFAYRAVDAQGVWVRLLLTLPGLAVALGAPVAGWLCDRYGRRGPLLVGLLGYGLAGGSGLVLEPLWALLLSRILLGLTVALVMTAATSIITDAWSASERPRILGLQGATMALGGVVFLLLGGLLAAWWWRGPFAVYLLALPLCLPALLLGLPLRPAPQVGQRPQFLRILPVLILAFLAMAAFYLIPVQVPFLIESILGGGPTAAGMVIAGGSLASALTAALVLRPLLARIGPPRTAALALAAIGSGLALIGLIHHQWWGLIGGVLVVGLGGGLSMPLGATWISRQVPASARGRALGALTAAVFLGQFASPLLVAPFLSWGPAAGFWVIATMCAVVALWMAMWCPANGASA